MTYYAGESFKKAKEYKTLEGAKKAADRDGLNVYDSSRKRIYQGKKEETEAEEAKPQEVILKKEAAQDDNSENDAVLSDEEAKQLKDRDVIDVQHVEGMIRRVFHGKVRLRREPNPDDGAICGVTSFQERRVVNKYVYPDKKTTFYETEDGFFISGDPDIVEFIPDEDPGKE